ncbi:NAD(P)H-binding protein [Patiriisocius hiemis]|uniref:NAD(P)H-binding protein n=1 Tax=Patiriisocius hiemis TaxID=3075604 RepID=A0ABU2YF52_9FLAO|nr:NAD(P)H-binding protein [Constantimarinum sp. W242]MDT0555673.1 NAD(P)H-binding protein [Constantimarinum sp. W242]
MENSINKTAILLGATGLTGGILLNFLLKDNAYSKIKIFGRSSVNINDQKIEEHLVDLFKLQDIAEEFKGDVVFCCIGTTKAKTPDKDTYKKIDYGIPTTAAHLAKRNNISTFVVISSLGANAKSSNFYSKVKGEMEREVLSKNIKDTFILQPSLIGGSRDEKRIGERLAQITMKIVDFLIPKKYKIIEPETVAKAMIVVSKKGYNENIIPSDKIKEIANA